MSLVLLIVGGIASAVGVVLVFGLMLTEARRRDEAAQIQTTEWPSPNVAVGEKNRIDRLLAEADEFGVASDDRIGVKVTQAGATHLVELKGEGHGVTFAKARSPEELRRIVEVQAGRQRARGLIL